MMTLRYSGRLAGAAARWVAAWSLLLAACTPAPEAGLGLAGPTRPLRAAALSATHRAAAVPADTSHGALAGILADVRRRSLDFNPGAGASLTAGNYRQHLTATLAAGRYTLAADTAGHGGVAWQLCLTLRGIGRAGAAPLRPVADTARPTRAGGRATYQQSGFAVDYDNTEAGLRQTYRLPERPAGTGPVRVTLALTTSLRAEAIADTAVVFSASSSHAPVLRYGSLRAWDATGRRLPATMRLAADGQALALVVNDAGAAYPLTIDPLASTAGATLNGANVGDTFATSVTLAGDLNGDGYGDVVVGAPAAGGGAGAIYLYPGSSTGLAATATFNVTGPSTDARFGTSVAGAGDLNGDGYGDLLIGAPGYAGGQGVLFFLGGSSSFFSNPTALNNNLLGITGTTGRLGAAVAGIGDLNGDGYDDVVAGAPAHNNNSGYYSVVYGDAGFSFATSVSLGGASGYQLGASVAGLGDLNGDGYADLAVGAPGVSAANIILGGTGTTVTNYTRFFLSPGGTGSGTSVAGPGDLNGDGYADLLIGAPAAGTGGRVYVYQGSTTLAAGTAPTATLDNPNAVAGDQFGQALSGAGDTNGDGYADFAVGSPGYSGNDGKGRAYVYGGTGTAGTYAAALVYTGEASGDRYGSSLGGGDCNGDGYGDLLIGAPTQGSSRGRAYAYYGSPAPLTASSPASTFSEPAATASTYFGYRTVAAGDLNGDGYAEVLVGTYTHNNTPGRAYFYLGSSSGLSATPYSLDRPTSVANDYFGEAVAGAGDVNGDGYADVLVGSPGGGGGQGRAYLYLGRSGGLTATPTTFSEPGAAAGNGFGASVAMAGDVNSDGYADLLIGATGTSGGQGRTYLYLGRSNGPATTPTLTLTEPGAAGNQEFGWSLAPAGDVNGDGYADVLVGSAYVNEQGRVYLYLGTGTGLAATPTTTLVRAGAADYDEFGQNLSGAGDVNNDGYADVLLGAYGVSTAQGRAYLYLGGSSGLATTPTTTLTEPTPANGNYFGTNVGSAGDTNGDGYADVLVGANGTSNSQGRAYLYLGSSTGLAATPTTLAEPGSTGAAYFGISLNAVGDVNGDGYGDLAIGADASNNNAGRFYLYLGNQGVARAGGLRLYGTDYTPITASNRTASQFGIGLTARNVAGRIRARLVWEVVGRGQAFTGSPTPASATAYSGRSVWSDLPVGGPAPELRALVTKVSRANRVRARLEYASSPLPATAPANGTGGPASRVRYGPWTYVAAQQAGLSTSAATPLPVELVAFTATAAGPAAAQLAWTTASEANSVAFEVQRSADGTGWTTLGRVAAAGSSATTRRYGYLDAAAPAGTSYYRLRQVDQDGTTAYSPVQTVTLGGVGGLALYPNPTAGAATLTGAVPGAAVQVLDALGRVAATATVGTDGTAALGGLAPGLYVVRAGASSVRLAVE